MVHQLPLEPNCLASHIAAQSTVRSCGAQPVPHRPGRSRELISGGVQSEGSCRQRRHTSVLRRALARLPAFATAPVADLTHASLRIQ